MFMHMCAVVAVIIIIIIIIVIAHTSHRGCQWVSVYYQLQCTCSKSIYSDMRPQYQNRVRFGPGFVTKFYVICVVSMQYAIVTEAVTDHPILGSPAQRWNAVRVHKPTLPEGRF